MTVKKTKKGNLYTFKEVSPVKEPTTEEKPKTPEQLKKEARAAARDLEDPIVRTDYTKGWKTRTIVLVLKANVNEVVYRHELAQIVGSDCKNVHIIIDTLTKGTKTYPAMEIAYDKIKRVYTYSGYKNGDSNLPTA